MPLKFKCKNCGKDIVVKFLKIGEIAQCNNCGAKNEVPETALQTDEKRPSISKTPPEAPEEQGISKPPHDIRVSKKQTSEQAIQSAFRQSRIKFIKGAFSAHVLLTPDIVKRVWDDPQAKKWRPRFLEPRCEFSIDPYRSSTSLQTWTWKERYTPKTYNTGIYQGRVKFSHYCCKCMKPATRFELVELRDITHPCGRIGFPGATAKEAQLITEAMSYTRFWYAIPFCQEHDLQSKAVGFSFKESLRGTRMAFEFTNREYGKRFAELNKLKGKWLTKTALFSGTVLFLGLVIGGTLSVIGGITVFTGGFRASRIERGLEPLSSVTGLALLLPGIAIVMLSLIYYMRKKRGEEL